MDERIEAFMKQVLDLEGTAGIGEAVRILLADYGSQFSDIPKKSYRDRVNEEIARHKGTPIERHLRTVLATIDSGSRFPLKK
jgi:hypothetical protein